MLILAKAAMAILLGFILAIITGVILIPILKRFHIGQYVSHYIGEWADLSLLFRRLWLLFYYILIKVLKYHII